MDENKEMITENVEEKETVATNDLAESAGSETSNENNSAETETNAERELPATPAESEEPAPPVATEVSPTSVPKTEGVKWNYARQLEDDRKRARKRGRRGALIYAIIMTLLFAVCFTVLTVLLIIGGTEGPAPEAQYPTVDDGMGIPSLVQSVEKSVITVSVKTVSGSAIGSGFVYNGSGYVLTNYHVIDDAVTISIIDYSGKEYPAKLVDGDEISDVAVLYVKGLPLPEVKLGDSSRIILGEQVVAIGTPLEIEYAGTVTNGIVSGIDRRVPLYNDAGFLTKTMTLIQTNTTLNPGNSGGPLFNMRGEVIGINTLKHVSSEGSDINYEGIGFAIRINDAIEIANDIIEDGEYSGNKGSASQGVALGIKCGDVYKGVSQAIGEGEYITPEDDGVYVSEITEGYPAYGKLQRKDIIVSFNGVRTRNVDEMTVELYKCKVGDTVTLEVWRDGKLISVEITL